MIHAKRQLYIDWTHCRSSNEIHMRALYSTVAVGEGLGNHGVFWTAGFSYSNLVL